jgi:hypothetical protein
VIDASIRGLSVETLGASPTSIPQTASNDSAK